MDDISNVVSGNNQRPLLIGLTVLCLLSSIALLIYWYYRNRGKAATPLSGRWTAYTSGNEKRGYDWRITQRDATNLHISDVNMPTTQSVGTLVGDTVTAPQFELTGTLSADKSRITWSDGSYWVKVQ
jgi:hypothetical protein